MANQSDIIDVQMTGDTTGLVQAVKNLENVTKAANAQFKSMSDFLDQINQKASKLKNVSNTVNNSVNINSKNPTDGSQKHGFISHPDGTNNDTFRKLADAVTEETEQAAEHLKEQVKIFYQILENKTKQVNTYAESVAKQASKEVNEANKKSKTLLNNAQADYKREQTKLLRETGQNRFTDNWHGGLASILSNYGTRLRGKGGLVGAAARFGDSSLSKEGSFWGKSGLANKFLGTSAGTLSGKGIALGGVALGGFTAALGAAVNAIKEFTSASLDAYGKMQSLGVSLEVVYGNKVQSEAAFTEIKNYAIHSPFSVSEMTEMAILLKQSGVYASELQNTLEMIGDVSGGNKENMKRIANNYAQIQAIGHANMLDMRQFAYAGLPIYEEVAKYMKVTQSELRNRIRKGEVSSEVIENVFKNMTSKGGIFYKSVEKGAKTYSARQINLEDIKNVALSEWGKFFWEPDEANGSSLAKSITEIKEGFWQWTGDVAKTLNAWEAKDNALAFTQFETSLESAYINALRDNNIPLAKAIKEQMNENKGNQDVKESLFIESYKNKRDIDGKVVSDSEYQEAVDQLIAILYSTRSSIVHNRRQYSNIPGKGTYDRVNSWDSELFNYEIKKIQENPYEYFTRIAKGATIQSTNNEANKRLDSLRSILTNSTPVSVLNKTMFKDLDSKKTEETFGALYTMKDYAREAADSLSLLNTKAKESSTSLMQMNINYKKEYESTGDRAKEKEEKDWKEFSERYTRLSSLFSNTKGSIDLSRVNNRDELVEYYKSNISDVQGLNFNSIVSDSKSGDRKKFYSNLTTVSNELKYIRKGSKSEQEIKEIESITASMDTVKSLMMKNLYNDGVVIKDDKEFIKNLYVLNDLIKNSSSSDVQTIASNLYNRIFAPSELSPHEAKTSKKGKKLDAFQPLWKRILASATGWDASHIKTNGVGFMEMYQNQQRRKISAGAFTGLVNAGGNLNDISGLLAYNGKEAQFKTKQIDWRKTENNILQYAMDIGTPIKKQVGVLNGLTQSMQEQLGIYNKLSVDMMTVGEDWSNIKKEFSNMTMNEAMFMENAFAGDFAQSGGKNYNLGFDSKKRSLVLKDTGNEMLEGKSIEELQQAVKDGVITDESLVKIINGLTIKTESIKPVLEQQRTALQALTDVIKVTNTIAQSRLESEKNIALTKMSTSIEGSGLLGILFNAIGLQNGFSNLGTNKEERLYAENSLNDFLKKFTTSLMDIDVNAVLNDESGSGVIKSVYKSMYGKEYNENDIETKEFVALSNRLTELLNTAKVLQNSSSTEKEIESALENLFKEMGDDLNTLVETYKNAARANNQSVITNTASTLLQETIKDPDKLLYQKKGNSLFEQALLNAYGYGNMSFDTLSESMTEKALTKGSKYTSLRTDYKNAFNNYVDEVYKKKGEEEGVEPDFYRI